MPKKTAKTAEPKNKAAADVKLAAAVKTTADVSAADWMAKNNDAIERRPSAQGISNKTRIAKQNSASQTSDSDARSQVSHGMRRGGATCAAACGGPAASGTPRTRGW